MWYRSLLSGDEAEAYDGIRDGVLSLEREIRIPRMEYRTAADILAKVKLDDPGIFWVRGHSVSFRTGAYEPFAGVHFSGEADTGDEETARDPA